MVMEQNDNCQKEKSMIGQSGFLPRGEWGQGREDESFDDLFKGQRRAGKTGTAASGSNIQSLRANKMQNG